MKKCSLAILFITFAIISQAFQPFQIDYPKKGQIVRETFKVLIPKKSVPKDTYIAFWANNKFIGAFQKLQNKTHYIYKIDSKAANIPDGKTKLQAFLFGKKKVNGKLKSVALTDAFQWIRVQNSKGIDLPAKGIQLRYKFKSNSQCIYRLKEYVRPTNTPAIPIQPVAKFRIAITTYNVQNQKEGQQAVIRICPAPAKGSKMIQARSGLNLDQTMQIDPQDVIPINMKVNNRGEECFGLLSPTMLDSNQIKPSDPKRNQKNYYIPMFLPILPKDPVNKGDSWEGFIPVSRVALNEKIEDKITKNIKTSASLESFEWLKKRKCAKITYSLDFGNSMTGFSYEEPDTNKIFSYQNAKQTIWLDIDKGVIIKQDTIQTGTFKPALAEEKYGEQKKKRPPISKKIRPGGASKRKPKKTERDLSPKTVIVHTTMVLE